MRYPQLITLVASPLLLSACGGGGDDDPTTPPERIEGKYDDTEFSGGMDGYRNITLKDKNRADIFLLDKTSNRIAYEHAILPFGLNEMKGQLSAVANDGKQTSENVTIRSYRGYYASVLETSKPTTVFPEMRNQKGVNGLRTQFIVATDSLPANAIYTYKGTAFNNIPSNDAALTYTIDYGKRRGFGEIAAAGEHGKITLEEAPIRYYPELIGVTSAYGVKDGVAKGSVDSIYRLGIAGENAEEIIGYAGYNPLPAGDVLNFIGTR